MAFMVPLVKNHYDIYARNAPADADNKSLYLSTTSLKSGTPVTKQYRIVIAGGKIATNKTGNQRLVSNTEKTKPPGVNLYYRTPSSSISLPVERSNSTKISKPTRTLTNEKNANRSPEVRQNLSGSPPSRPVPHVRRTARNPVTNRVYSYSVSIPDYVVEEDEEALEEKELKEIDLEDKENDALFLFSTSAPSGTGLIISPTPTPPSAKMTIGSVSKKQPSHSMPSSPDSLLPLRPPFLHQRTLSSTSTSTSSSNTNSREYVEILRKFIFHLKMLKIGGSKARRIRKSNTESSSVDSDDNQLAQRKRKKKDVTEDSKHL